jgi:ketosteroid isomerase-like protein
VSAADNTQACQAVENVLTDWYAAITRQDINAVAALLTEDFLIVETDTLMERAVFLKGLAEGFGMGRQTGERGDFHTAAAGDTAWTTLRNHETWTPDEGEPLPLEFLETVVFQRLDGRWLIARYHATRLAAANA